MSVGPDSDIIPLDPWEETNVAVAGVIERQPRVFVRGSRVWRLVNLAGVALGFLLALLPTFVLPPLEARLITRFVALVVAMAGLQFVVGWCRQLSLCHGVFVGLGSYTTTILVGSHGRSHLEGVLLSPVVGFLGGTVIGLVALRIRALYLGPVTLAAAVAFPTVVKRFSWFTGGSSGLPILREVRAPQFLQHLGFAPERPYRWAHLIVCVVATLALVVAHNLRHSPTGLVIRAAATNPISAAASGVNVARTRVVAYACGAALGAVGGSLLVLDTPIVSADSYDLFRSLGYYAAVVVGGVGSMAGGAMAAGLLVGVPWIFSVYDVRLGPNLVLGLLLITVTSLAPGGVAAALAAKFAQVVTVVEPSPEAGAGPRRPNLAR